MREYWFSLTRTLPHKDRIVDYVLMRVNAGQWKPVFSHISCCVIDKHSDLDLKLTFNEHINESWRGVVKRLSSTNTSRNPLTIHKSFVRPLLDYADVVYSKPFNERFENKLCPVHCNAYLITAIELGLKSLSDRTCSHKSILFYKIIKEFSKPYFMHP